MPTPANRKQLTVTELFTVDENQKHEQQSASHIEDSDTEVTLRLPNHLSEQPSTQNHPTATPINRSGMERFLLKCYDKFDGSDENTATHEVLIYSDHNAEVHTLRGMSTPKKCRFFWHAFVTNNMQSIQTKIDLKVQYSILKRIF